MWQTLSSLLPEAAKRNSLAQTASALTVIQAAKNCCSTVLGNSCAERVSFKWFKNGTLVMSTKSSAARQECELRKEDLKQALNAAVGQNSVKNILILFGGNTYE